VGDYVVRPGNTERRYHEASHPTVSTGYRLSGAAQTATLTSAGSPTNLVTGVTFDVTRQLLGGTAPGLVLS